jgi:hypothetical protein
MSSPEQWDPESNFRHQAVLHYLKNKWAVLPVWWMEGGRCACGNCNAPGKHPIHTSVQYGVRDATLDQNIAFTIQANVTLRKTLSAANKNEG